MIRRTATQVSDGTIYYLQTSTPHLYDTSISGPYHNLDAIAAQIQRNFGAECQPGTQYLDEMLEAGINGNPSLTKTARILRETNPTMLAQLPGPTWYIVVAELAVEIASLGLSDPGASMPLEDAQVHGTFGDASAANDAARQLPSQLENVELLLPCPAHLAFAQASCVGRMAALS
ncbi:hypothetical protein LTR27_002677 [Elasticomyces elasticus]|nr:hypothetical protein LTR27_002677 [Elasticomyces elasticus]